MNSLELNKVFAAVLTAGITFMVAGQVGKILVHGEKPHESAILIGDPSGGAPAGSGPAAPAGPEPISGLLASADVEAGQQIAARNCGACHSFNQGGKAGIGPNLYGIVGAPHGHAEGFNYSAAIKGKAGPWNYDELNAWLYKPATYAPGTRMAYAGLANTQQRANVVAYLRSLSPNPAPLPPAGQPAAAATPAAPMGTAPGTPPAARPVSNAELAPIGPLLAAANVENGAALARRTCGVCHTFTEGGRNGVGPNLYDVVGKPHGHLENFNYSAALKAKTGPWNYEELNAWLNKPATYAPGTRMVLAGIPKPEDRADIIAYLRSLSPNPQPLP
ncbi:cytochrome c family protein [Paeniroseomonas aquatica]|uniref:Cytochrome c family protein n=1 Tax=Paeniroseomonas aquatica TaxID=373043 RepID=A0ABT8ADQ2_9PROT|nr:cytochrome c family protein [Paeniroseomonas aquatica]MDN3567601.1 cytochrome c family protein [Paeniroseomonas aquatica]